MPITVVRPPQAFVLPPRGPRGNKGDKPAHEWNETSIRFQNPDGSWGDYVDLAGLNDRGAWAAGNQYKKRDLVQHDGSSYVCYVDHLSDAATEPGVGVNWQTVWHRLAAKGDKGDQGPTGSLDVDGQFTADFPQAVQTGFKSAVQATPGFLTPDLWGAAGDGVTDDTGAFEKMCADLANTGLVAYIKAGKVYRLTSLAGTLAVTGFTIAGSGLFDFQNVTERGSVILLDGTADAAAFDVFTLTDGGAIEGVTFYYPSQVPNVAAPAVTPAGYICRLAMGTSGRGGRVCNNYFVNGYNCIRNDAALTEITGNYICAINVAIEDTQATTEHWISRNSITIANWYASIGQDIRDYIAQNAVCFKLTNTAATFTENHVFGMFKAYQFLGRFPFVTISGGFVDGCRWDIYLEDGCGDGYLAITGADLSSNTVSHGNNTTSELVTLKSGCIYGENPASDVSIVVAGGSIGGANGNLMELHNPSGSGTFRLSVSGTRINSPGRYAHTHTLPVSGITGTFANGDVITGGTSGATATVRKFDGTDLYLDDVIGTFQNGETVTAAPSGATATAGDIVENSTYWAVLFGDAAGTLVVDGTENQYRNYAWCAGVYVVTAKKAIITDNAFESPVSTAKEMVKVDACDSLVVMGNASDLTPTAQSDITIDAAVVTAKVGPNNWARQPSGNQDRRPFFSAAKAAPQLSDGTLTDITFDIEDFDIGGGYDGEKIFFAPEAGVYVFDTQIKFGASVTPGDTWRLTIAAGAVNRTNDIVIAAAVAGGFGCHSGPVYLDQHQAARVRLQRLSGTGQMNVTPSGSYFTGRKLD